MNKLCTALLLAIVTLAAKGQHQGEIIYDRDGSELISSLLVDREYIIAGCHEAYKGEFQTRLVKMTETGDIVWQSDFLDTGNFQENMLFRDGYEYILGGYNGFDILIFHFSLDGDLTRTDTISNPDYPRQLISNLVPYGGAYYACCQAFDNLQNEGNLYSLIYKISPDGQVLDLYVDPTRDGPKVRGAEVGPDGLLTIYREMEGTAIDTSDGQEVDAVLHTITKYDTSHQVVWAWESPPSDNLDDYTRDFDINRHTGDMATIIGEVYYSFFVLDYYFSLVSVDTLGSLRWQYDYEINDVHNIYYFVDIEVMDNGHVLAAGIVRDRSESIMAVIVCHDADDGHLLWEKRYALRPAGPTSSLSHYAGFSCVQSPNDTTIIVGGYSVHEPTDNVDDYDGWILILDEHGCHVPDCGDLIVTPTSEVAPLVEVVDLPVYPSPTADIISWLTPITGSYEVYSIQGQTVMHGELDQSSSLDLSHLPSATYTIRLYDRVADQLRVARVIVAR